MFRRLAVTAVVALVTIPAGGAHAAPAKLEPAAAATGAEGEFHPLDPDRVYSSRTGAPLGPREVRHVPIAGLAGVPATGVQAVALNVTVDQPSTTSYLSVFPRDNVTTDPKTSNLNFRAGVTTPNMVIVRLGLEGHISIFNAAGTAHVLVDVMGWFNSAGGAPGTLYHALTPVRAVDTRFPGRSDGSIRPVGPNDGLTLSLTGGASAATAKRTAFMMNVTATNQTEPSFLSVFPYDSTQTLQANLPRTSNLNFRPGQGAVPNAAITKINAANGAIGFYNFTGNVDVLADLFGYFDDGTEAPNGQLLRVLPQPARVMDTRTGLAPPGSLSGSRLTLTAGETRTVRLTGDPVSGVPATGVVAAVLNITVDRAGASGFISVYPANLAPEDGRKTSTLNFIPGVTVPNLSIAPLGLTGANTGQLSIYNGSPGAVDILVDVFGYFVLA